jgi:dihydrolipoamide dehydrogenase
MSKGVHFLMKKNKIEVLNGHGKLLKNKKILIKNNNEEVEISADKIIIATGSRSRVIDTIPQNGKNIIGYREAMTLSEQPKELVIVGSGAIGIEFAYFFNSMGTKVTIIEYLDRILPNEDEEISSFLEKISKRMVLIF